MIYLYIACISVFGALCRYSISLLLHAPMYTIIVNLIGAFALGYCTTYFKRLSCSALIKTGVTTGFLGSFTTFSALSKDVADLYLAHHYLSLIIYYSISIFGGIICAAIGLKWGDRN